MKISVVIPLYNKDKYIVRCLTSVFAQTYDDFELIVVDDGSTDESVDTLNFVYGSNAKLRVIKQENGGVSAARNRGLKESEGEIIAFLDADDEWLPTHLSDIAETAKTFPNAGLIGTGYREIGSKGFVSETTLAAKGSSLIHDYFRAATVKPILTMSSSAVLRFAYEKMGGFTEKEALGEDLAFYARYAICYPVAFHSSVSAIYHNYVTDATANNTRRNEENPTPLVVREIDIYRKLSKGNSASLKRYIAKILYEHIVFEIIRGKSDRVAQLLKNPLLKSQMNLKATGLKLAIRWLPENLLRSYLRFNRSRWGLSRIVRRDGVFFKIISIRSTSPSLGKISK